MSNKDDFYKDENKNVFKTAPSPSGKYKLVISSYDQGKGYWNYTRGEVYENEKRIADVKRNYSAFPFSWIEGHKNGHDYLICGEDYQGQTIVELDTGKRLDHMSKGHDKGHGFCWAAHSPSPDGTMLLVSGCYWACPYEFVIFDFSEPMSPPWKELFRCDQGGCDDEDVIDDWVDNETCRLGAYYRTRKSDGKNEWDFTLEELDDVPEDDEEWDAYWDLKDEYVTWRRGEGLVEDGGAS
jgi:hypothetical protein